MYKVITDLKEKESLLGTYFSLINKRSLKYFTQILAYGDDFIGVYLKKYLEQDPYEFQRELSEIKDRQLLLLALYPATISDEKDAEEAVYIDFDEFYTYLTEVVDERIAESPEDKAEYQELLAEVKTALEL